MIINFRKFRKLDIEEGQWLNPNYLSSNEGSENSNHSRNCKMSPIPSPKTHRHILPSHPKGERRLQAEFTKMAAISVISSTGCPMSCSQKYFPRNPNSFTQAIESLSESDPVLVKYKMPKLEPGRFSFASKYSVQKSPQKSIFSVNSCKCSDSVISPMYSIDL